MPPKTKLTTAASNDPLLAGLSRLSTADNPPALPAPAKPITPCPPPPSALSVASSSTRPASSVAHHNPPPPASAFSRHIRSSTVAAAPSASYRVPPPRIQPLNPVSRADTLQLIERATGHGTRAPPDPAAVDQLLSWLSSASLPCVDAFRALVAGPSPADAALNTRVLALVHTLLLHGGPSVLSAALLAPHAKRPSHAMRIVYEVLRALGHTDVEAVLHDDALLSSTKVSVEDGLATVPHRRVVHVAPMTSATEAYAIALGRKLLFHTRHRDIEANFSLDRFFRAVHVENNAEQVRCVANDERRSMIVHRSTLHDIELLTRAAVTAAQRLRAADTALDIQHLALGEACNAAAFADYLRSKLSGDFEERSGLIDLTNDRLWLFRRTRAVVERGGTETRLMKRYVDNTVFRSLDERSRPCRPESRHRREIVCQFESFAGLHAAVAPPLYAQR